MSAIWKFSTPAGDLAFSDLRVSQPRGTFINQDTDTFTFTLPVNFDVAPLFAYKSIATVKQNDTQYFYGRVIDARPNLSARDESMDFTLAGPWWDLKNIIFQKYRKVLSDPLNPNSALTNIYTSHFLMNLTVDGAHQTIAQQLQEIVQYAIDQGTPIQLDLANLPNYFVPLDEVRETTCADAIVSQLRWVPDASVFFDYTTTPATLRIKRRANLTPVSIDLKTFSKIPSVQIAPRYDLLAPGVFLKYEITNELNGAAYLDFATDIYPGGTTGRELGALVATISLEGAITVTTQADILTADVEPASVDWWKLKSPELALDTVKNLVITDSKRQTNLPRELVDGSAAEWMGGQVLEELVEATATYDHVDKDGKVLHQPAKTIHTRIRATDLVTRTYRNIESTGAEIPPVGLAQALHVAASVLHYEGSIRLSEDECTKPASLGNLVNIANGRAEWAAMNGQPARIVEDIQTGATEIQIGAPKYLGRDAIMQLLRVTRGMKRYTSASCFATGRSSIGSIAVLGKNTPKENTVHGQPTFDKFTVAGSIVLDKADNPLNRGVKLRELPFCDNGKQRKILVPCSEVYD